MDGDGTGQGNRETRAALAVNGCGVVDWDVVIEMKFGTDFIEVWVMEMRQDLVLCQLGFASFFEDLFCEFFAED